MMKRFRVLKCLLLTSFCGGLYCTGYILTYFNPEVNDLTGSLRSPRRLHGRHGQRVGSDSDVIWSERSDGEPESELRGPQENMREKVKRAEQAFIGHSLKVTVSAPDPDKFVIYRCDPDALTGCLSWPEQARGMMMTYLVSTLTNRTFKAELADMPCKMTDYAGPRAVDWRMDASYHSFLRKGLPGVGIHHFQPDDEFLRQVSSTDFSRLTPANLPYVYFRSDGDFIDQLRHTSIHRRQVAWMNGLSPDRLYAHLFRTLFQLSPRLQKRFRLYLYAILPTPQHRLVCADLSSTPNSSEGHELGPEGHSPIDNLGDVWDFFHQHSKSQIDKIFIATDDDDVIDQARRVSFRNRLVSSPHSLTSRFAPGLAGKTCNDLENQAFDQYVLANCDILLVSSGQLGRTAAYIRGTDTGLYCRLPNGQIYPCRVNRLEQLYQMDT